MCANNNEYTYNSIKSNFLANTVIAVNTTDCKTDSSSQRLVSYSTYLVVFEICFI